MSKRTLQDYLKEKDIAEDNLLELLESGILKKGLKHFYLGEIIDEWGTEDETEELQNTYYKIIKF